MTKNNENENLKIKLKELIVSASDEALREIAIFDGHGGGGVTYEEACQLHFQNLNEMIAQNDCLAVWSKHYWYPMEAVDLRALTPDSGSPVSFGVAIAILLLDDLEGGGRDYMQERSSKKYLQKYQDLPKDFSAPILARLSILQEI